VRRLLEAGEKPIATYRERPNRALPDGVDQIPLSPENLVVALRTAAAVVHLAAKTGGIEFQRLHRTGLFLGNRAITDQVLQAAAQAGTPKVVLASSAAVYAPNQRPLSEDDPTVDPMRTESAYAAGKLLDEISASWVRRLDSATVIVARIGNVYGEGGQFDSEQSSVVHALLRRAVDSRESGQLVAWGSPDTTRSFVHVEDVADALVLLALAEARDTIYNVDSGAPVTIGQLASLIAAQAAPGSTVTFDETKPRGDPYRVLSISRLEGLGFEPRIDLESGISRTLAAFRPGLVS
jgi:GDP-L-fucose synthase